MDVFDLYAELGIGRGADDKAIRTAYRSLAKKAHPDTGGSTEAFERLQLAHAVLSDPERRKQYDETGRYDAGRVDNGDADALGVLIKMIEKFLGAEAEPETLDLPREITREAKQMLAQIGKAINQAERTKKRAEKLLGRFKTKDGEETPVEAMLRHQIQKYELAAKKHGQAKTAFERVIKLVEQWRFEREFIPDPFTQDAMQQRGSYSSLLNQFGSGTTSTFGFR